VVRVTASDTRSQRRNRDLAVERLMAQLDAANVVPRTRRPTRPKRSAVEQRLSDKHRASRRKQDRSWRDDA
jgi:ribosome-associated protein